MSMVRALATAYYWRWRIHAWPVVGPLTSRLRAQRAAAHSVAYFSRPEVLERLAEGQPPADERVRLPALWLAEVFTPSTFGRLDDGIQRLGLSRSRTADRAEFIRSSRSQHSSRGSRSTLSPRSSTRSPGRWLCSGCCSAAVGRGRRTRSATRDGGAVAFPGTAQWSYRSAQLPPAALAAGADRLGHRSEPPALRPAPHLRHLRAPRRHLDLRPLALHGRQPGDDRSPLRPPRPRRTRPRRRAARRLRARFRRVDVRWTPPQNPQTRTAKRLAHELTRPTFGAVDVSWTPPLRNVSSTDNKSSW
jgi:hypothetical protein